MSDIKGVGFIVNGSSLTVNVLFIFEEERDIFVIGGGIVEKLRIFDRQLSHIVQIHASSVLEGETAFNFSIYKLKIVAIFYIN